MKTRILEKTKKVDGKLVVTYLAEVHCWKDSLTWYPASLKLQWEGYFEDKEDCIKWDMIESLSYDGSLEKAKIIIDKLIKLMKDKEEMRIKLKEENRSEKVRIIEYP